MAARAAGHQPEAQANAMRKDRIGENCHAADPQEDRRMTEPDGGKLVFFPIS